VRDPARLAPDCPGLDIVVADVTDPATIVEALTGADAVVSAIGTRSGRAPTTVCADSSRSIVDAMHEAGTVASSSSAAPGRSTTAKGRACATSSFTPDGYLLEPIGAYAIHRGTAELRSFFTACFNAGGGIGLEQCVVTDDGVRCAAEYNCVRWGSRELPPQAGIGVYERDAEGLPAAARVYVDVEAPVEKP
jgi:hypothetical protein